MSSRKIFNYESKVLVEKTVREEGYHPDQFGPSSAKFIWAICRYCGEPSRIRKGFFNKAGSACHKACKIEEQKLASPFKNPETRKKAKQAILDKFGTEFASQNLEIARKISAIKRTSQYKDKLEKTNLARYGVSNVFQSEEVKKKIRATNLDRFGVDHPLKNPEIKAKASQAFRETFAADPANANGISTVLRGDKFWELLRAGKSIKEACAEFGLQVKDTTTILSRPEFREKYYESYTFPKHQIQNEIADELRILGLNPSIDDKTVIPPLEVDIFVREKNIGIEFNGTYWHSEACLGPEKAKLHHLTKTMRCRDRGITLVHIFEHQWPDRKEQFLNLIASLARVNSTKIPARNCSIDYRDCPEFIEQNHVQGPPIHAIKYFDLVFRDKIVGVMTASRHHRQNVTGNPVVLSRLCFSRSCTVQGGSSKLFKALTGWAKQEGYDRVISWSDNCWTEGNIYKTLGFSLMAEYPPDYFYWDTRNHKYISKQSQRKKATNCPQGMTERDWCIERGLFRVWDCGKKVWIYYL